MNAKQRAFALEYLKDLNATQAAIRAGYSPKTAESQGSRLLSNAKVAAFVAEGKAAREKRVGVDADFILSNAKELLSRCMQADPVLDKMGNETGEWRFDSAGANGALKLMASHVRGFHAPTKIEGEITDTKRIVLVFPEAAK